MHEYMLLMKGDDSAQASPAEMQQRMQDYMAWMTRMTAEERLVAGQPLGRPGVPVHFGERARSTTVLRSAWTGPRIRFRAPR